MRNLIVLVMIALLMPWNAMAQCEWKTGIHLLPDSNYEYSKECHIQVGLLKQDDEIKTSQVKLLTESLEAKDLALKAADDRATEWQNTSVKLDANIDTLKKMDSQNKWIYFGLGFLAASAAIYAADRLVHH